MTYPVKYSGSCFYPAVVTAADMEVATLDLPQTEVPVIHHFGPGIYIREVHMKAGTFAVGHHQKKEHLNILLKGAVRMLNPDGSTFDVHAPLLYVGKPGRKMGYVLEDVIWQNIYATDETDVQKLEELFLDKSEIWKAKNQISDQRDFKDAIKEIGFDELTVWEQSSNEDDQIPMPHGSWIFKTGNSNIHGIGIFATADAEAGKIIGPARLNGMRTPLGRYTNHSRNPNAKMIKTTNGDIYLQLTSAVSGCRGGMDGEEITIDYRESVRLA